MKGLGLAAWVVMLAAGSASGWAAGPATGEWKIDGDVQGVLVKMTCSLVEADKKLTGTCSGAGEQGTPEQTKPRTVKGQVTDAGLVWKFDSEYQGNPITVTMSGVVNADTGNMSGTIGVDPMGADGTFEAVKADGAAGLGIHTGPAPVIRAPIPPPLPSAGADAVAAPGAESTANAPAAATPEAPAGVPATASMTGVWKIEGDVMGNPVRMMCRLTETAKKIAGTCSGAQDGYTEHPVSGRVTAKGVEWHFQAAMGGNPIMVALSGRLEGDGTKMEGGIDLEPMQTGGTFAAVKAE